MNAVVIHPPVTIARDFIDYPYFANLGAAQLAAVLGCDWVDSYALSRSTLHWRKDGRGHLGAPVNDVLDAVAALGPRDVAIVAYTPFHRPPARDETLGALLTGLRAQFSRIILADCYQSGQHYVESSGEDVLASYPEVAAYVKYEAELAVPDLLADFVPGVHRGASPDLDALPFPAWDRIDVPAYHRFQERVAKSLARADWHFPVDGHALPMVTSRGCPFQCVHCSSNPGRAAGEPKTQRRYSEARLHEYLGALVALGAKRVVILDELVNVNERHFDALLDSIEAYDLRFDVPNGMRADYLEPRHIARMKGRVAMLSVSAESGSQRVVDEIVNKRLDLREIEKAAANAHAAGVPLLVHFIVGFPGETAVEINETLAFAMDLWDRHHAYPAVQFATPLPGTRLAEGRSLPVVSDWGPMFQKAPTQPGALVSPEQMQKFRWTFEQRLRASQGPEKVIMNVTYVCNNHCTFCAVGTRTQVHGHPPSQREHLTEYRKRGVTMVDFDGGEPTLNPELIPLIRAAASLGYERIHVTTNGRLCFYDDFADKLVNSGLSTLLFSVHGHDDRTHGRQVGVAEAFEQTIGGIKNCLAHAPKSLELGMNITLTKGNYDHLEAVAQLCWDLGLRWLNIQFLTPFGRATTFVAPDTAAAARIAADVIDRWKDRMKMQVINLPFCFMPDHLDFVLGDLNKLARHMIFVNNEDVNLADYLAERRVRKPECEVCPHAVFCGGFYELEMVPEPEWIIRAEDLVRGGSRLPAAELS